MTETPRILIVEARFYDDLADALLEGAKETLKAHGATFDVVTVPGALEVPTAIAMADEAGRYPTAPRYDGFVALGCINIVVAANAGGAFSPVGDSTSTWLRTPTRPSGLRKPRKRVAASFMPGSGRRR